MAFTNFRKETSERSDNLNWAKQCLVQDNSFYFDSIEGCNENNENNITHLFERARVDYDGKEEKDLESVRTTIINNESEDSLTRKINFAHKLGAKFIYVLYCSDPQRVWLYEFKNCNELLNENDFTSYQEFSNWLQTIKGWKSKKSYINNDLPDFDKDLREAGCPWPTNIDCFISDKNNQPIAILEFQNAGKISVKRHCNNRYFLGYCVQGNKHNDRGRWRSQELLRVRSCLRYFIVTWQTANEQFTLKEIERITFPLLPGKRDKGLNDKYEADLISASENNNKFTNDFSKTYNTYNLEYEQQQSVIQKIVNTPPLTIDNRTLPLIYYRYKQTNCGKKQLASQMKNLLERQDNP